LGAWFQNPGANCSSHAGADDQANTIGEYVKRPNKAWTQSNANPYCVSLELCGFASWSTSEWDAHPNMLANCAAWIAEECAHFGIPITRLNASQAQGSGRGVCQHVDLGAMGGGHWDCGSGFPMDRVLDMARGGGSAPASTEEDEMIASAVSDGGTLHVFWAGDDQQTVRYRYQRRGESAWNDGGVLTKAPKKIAGLSATTTATGTLELFARYDNGDVAHLWQKAGTTGWSGGEAGKQKAAFSALPG
jgi:hypothetical protein